MKTDNQFLSVAEAAELLTLHEETVRKLAREKRLPAFKAGRSWRFSRRKLEEWAAQHSNARIPARILVVDDEESIRDVFRILLEDVGYTVVTASTGDGAIAALHRGLPDLVLLDLKLPGRSGVHVIREIRERDKALPVVIVTGYPDSDLMYEAMAYSPLVVLAKPVDPDTLLTTVRSALRGRGLAGTAGNRK